MTSSHDNYPQLPGGKSSCMRVMVEYFDTMAWGWCEGTAPVIDTMFTFVHFDGFNDSAAIILDVTNITMSFVGCLLSAAALQTLAFALSNIRNYEQVIISQEIMPGLVFLYSFGSRWWPVDMWGTTDGPGISPDHSFISSNLCNLVSLRANPMKKTEGWWKFVIVIIHRAERIEPDGFYNKWSRDNPFPLGHSWQESGTSSHST